jgi:hypothetical protein
MSLPKKHWVKTTNVPAYANRTDLTRWLKKKDAPIPAAMYLWRDADDSAGFTNSWFFEYHKNYDINLLVSKIKQKSEPKDESVVDPFDYADVVPLHSVNIFLLYNYPVVKPNQKKFLLSRIIPCCQHKSLRFRTSSRS